METVPDGAALVSFKLLDTCASIAFNNSARSAARRSSCVAAARAAESAFAVTACDSAAQRSLAWVSTSEAFREASCTASAASRPASCISSADRRATSLSLCEKRIAPVTMGSSTGMLSPVAANSSKTIARRIAGSPIVIVRSFRVVHQYPGA